MEKNNLIVAQQETRELLLPFPLMKDLIDYAKGCGLGSIDSYEVYTSDEIANESIRPAVPLPERFRSVVSNYPGTYFLVYYIDRSDDYYREGGQFKEIGISTSEHRKTSDSRLREIHIKEPSASAGLGNVLRVEVEERVNEKSLISLNTAIGQDVNLPFGLARIGYEVRPDGSKRELAFYAERLDEGLFEWNGEQKHIRWLRDVKIDKSLETQVISYRDTYLVGLRPEGGSEQRSEVKFTIKGNLSEPQQIVIEIGSGPQATAEVLFQDEDKGVRVLLHKSIDKSGEAALNILKQNPNYAFMFKIPINTKELITALTFMIETLQNDWDKPQTVFSQSLDSDLSQASLRKIQKE